MKNKESKFEELKEEKAVIEVFYRSVDGQKRRVVGKIASHDSDFICIKDDKLGRECMVAIKDVNAVNVLREMSDD